MRKEIKLQGVTVDEKLVHAEIMLTRMSRRLHKTFVGVIPPSIVSFSKILTPEDGIVCEFLVPEYGKITKACLSFQGKEDVKDPVKFEIKIGGAGKSFTQSFETKKKYVREDVSLETTPGEVLSLTVTNPETTEKVFVSFLYFMERNKNELVEIALDEIDGSLEDL